jgi:uncharacterized protein
MKINIKHLKEGLYHFDFITNRNSIDLVEDEVFINNIEVRSTVQKSDVTIFVKSRVKTLANFVCDKCLVEFERFLEDEFTTIYTLDRETYDLEDENVVLIYPNTQEIDLKYGVRDSILLAKPMKTVCSEECKGLCPTCGVNLNEETCQCMHESIDPRWQELKKLLD